MAYIRTYKFTPHDIEVMGPSVAMKPKIDEGARLARRIFWSDHTEWDEASLYLAIKLSSGGPEAVESVRSKATHIRAFAEYIESNPRLEWNVFPERDSLRPTYAFRGSLLKKIRARSIAPSTAKYRINTIRLFYQWALRNNLVAPEYAPYLPRYASIPINHASGAQDTILVQSSDLNIRNPSCQRLGIEDNLMPLSRNDRDVALQLARQHCTEEYALALELGFLSGIRIGSIVDLSLEVLDRAEPSRVLSARTKDGYPVFFSIPLGPFHGVHTKGGVNYWPSLPRSLLIKLKDYATSTRRLSRAAIANPNVARLLFISQRGRQFTTTSWQHEQKKMKCLAIRRGVDLKGFKFHCSRATFGTIFATSMLSVPSIATINVVAMLKALLGHARGETSLSYVKWLENRGSLEDVLDMYGEELFGGDNDE